MSFYYTALRKGLEWCRKTAFELLLGTTIVNSYVVFNVANKNSSQNLSILQFREKLAFPLISDMTDHQRSWQETALKLCGML
nr:unnamed protein product [Callosobruchus chinensis]